MINKYFRFLIRRLAAVSAALFLLTILNLTLACILPALFSGGFRLHFILISGAVCTALLYLSYRWIYIPYQETKRILNGFIQGYTAQDVFSIRYPVSPEIEAALSRFKDMVYTKDLINATRRQAQYLALQNQINPHFLYNTLEGIRGEALAAKLYTVSDMTEALGNFFRYTISNMDNLVNLEDELINVNNYYLIQQYRFGERIFMEVIFDDENGREALLKSKMPKLTLQPIVENAIYHGIERKTEKGAVKIRIQATLRRLIITVSDDGIGMDQEQLGDLTAKLNVGSLEYINQLDEQRGGIAIVNVSNRIRLLFGEAYGIHIFSTLGVGTDVEITLPYIKDSEDKNIKKITL